MYTRARWSELIIYQLVSTCGTTTCTINSSVHLYHKCKRGGKQIKNVRCTEMENRCNSDRLSCSLLLCPFPFPSLLNVYFNAGASFRSNNTWRSMSFSTYSTVRTRRSPVTSSRYSSVRRVTFSSTTFSDSRISLGGPTLLRTASLGKSALDGRNVANYDSKRQTNGNRCSNIILSFTSSLLFFFFLFLMQRCVRASGEQDSD